MKTQSLLTSFKLSLIAIIGAIFLKTLYLTLRVKFVGKTNIAEQKNVISAFWHNQQLGLPLIFKYWNKNGDVNLNVLISAHQDGRIIANIIKFFGINSIAGSSSRGGAKALKGMIDKLKQGDCVAVTPDGPKGPIYKCKAGVAELALLTNCKILPLAYSAKCWEFSSWDKMLLPKPFQTITFIVGDPYEVEQGKDLAIIQQELEQKLNQLKLV